MMILQHHLSVKILWILVFLNATRAENPFSWRPSVSLKSNLDEPQQLGFCLDISGFGSSINCNLLQAHSCKQAGADTQFEFVENGMIRAVNFDANCNTINSTGNRACVYVIGEIVEEASLGLTECNESAVEQTFELANGEELQIGDGLCLAVNDTTRQAGPFVARDLFLRNCESTPAELKVWAIRREADDVESSAMPSAEGGSTAMPSTITPSTAPPSPTEEPTSKATKKTMHASFSLAVATASILIATLLD